MTRRTSCLSPWATLGPAASVPVEVVHSSQAVLDLHVQSYDLRLSPRMMH